MIARLWISLALLGAGVPRPHDPELLAAIAAEAGDEREAALLVAIVARESGGDPRAVNAGRTSFCAMQIETSPARGRELLASPRECLRTGARMMRASLAACAHLRPAWRLAVYARGSCSSERGRELSADRVALSERAYRHAAQALAPWAPWEIAIADAWIWGAP